MNLTDSSRFWRRCLFSSAAIFTLSILPQNAHAGARTWLPTNGDWFTDNNWSGSAIPTNLDDAFINTGTATADIDNSAGLAKNLTVGNGTLAIKQGKISVDSATYIGRDYSTNALVTVAGSTATLFTSQLYVGSQGKGTLSISNGGRVFPYSGNLTYLGYGSTGDGTINVSGANTSWTASPYASLNLRIGESGKGTLNVSSGATVTASAVVLAGQSSGTGRVFVSGLGSKLTGNTLLVGSNGNGELQIADHASVQVDSIILGANAGASGTVTVTGENSLLMTSALTVGQAGGGTLTIANKGKVTTDTIALAQGAQFTSGVINIGEYAGNSTAGSFGKTNTRINLGTNGTLNLNQTDSFSVYGMVAENGNVYQRGSGTTAFFADNTYTGSTTVSSGTLLINGNQSNATGEVVVGENGHLGGNGVIGGSTKISGVLSPGTSYFGKLTIDDNLTLESTARISLTFAGATAGTYNQLQVNGSFLVNEGAKLELISVGYVPTQGDVFMFFLGTFPTFAPSQLMLPALNEGLSWDTSNLGLTGQVSVVPEPEIFYLAVAGALLLYLFGKRRIEQRA